MGRVASAGSVSMIARSYAATGACTLGLVFLWACQNVSPETVHAPAADWKPGAVCYEIFVRSFFDSDGDGIGDLAGVHQKLDYINDGDPETRGDLGASCIWLMPVAQSPSYHGYDVTDYYRVDREYGTHDDFRHLVEEAHRRGIRVLTDLVLNHASGEHPFFKDALLNPDSPYREWFVWSPTHPGALNPWGGDNWHRSPVRDEYYYGFFWSGMPDLNYLHPPVLDEAKNVARFWLEEMGVDGFRLDAVSFLVEEAGIVQHAAGTHAVLRELGQHIREIAPRSLTIGEVWDSTGAMLPYYPDQLDAYFAFEVSDALVESIRSASAAGLLSPVLRLQESVSSERWAPFLRNHDQTRTLTALGGDTAAARLAATLLLTLPGLPFVYYGEEIGMTGDKPDPRIRTPMQWSPREGGGFTEGLAWEPLQPDSMTTTVSQQDGDPGSLLNHYRELIHLRAADPALAAGEIVPLRATEDAVVAYLRRAGERTVLVLANLGLWSLDGVSLFAERPVLPAGRYDLRELIAEEPGRPLMVQEDERISGWIPVDRLRPRAGHVFEIVTTEGPATARARLRQAAGANGAP